MIKDGKIKELCNHMNECDSKSEYTLLLLYLRHEKVIKYIKHFIDMNKKDITNEMLDNIEVIITHAKTLYEMDRYIDPYNDTMYDKMLSRFKKFRPEPFGNNTTGLANSTYKYDKLSGTLDKAHFIFIKDKPDNDDRLSIEEFMDNIPISDNEQLSVLCNQKKDGNSVTGNFILKNGRYVAESGISRGKKDYGEGTDVSIIFSGLSFEPDGIEDAFGYLPEAIGVQFEFLISARQCKAFQKFINRDFVNLRSAASGLLRRILFSSKKDFKVMKNFISLVPVGFDILKKDIEDGYEDYGTWNQKYDAICNTFIYGDVSMKYDVFHGTKSEIMDQFIKFSDKQLKKRNDLNHAIDGIVMTILDPDVRKKMGRKNHINKFQIAYKFPEESYKTKIRDIQITTGNFGYKEILLLVDPVILNGTTQFKAQVHSLNRFRKMNLRYGDEIILKLSGDVIPYGYKDQTCKKGDGKKIKLPTHCECGCELVEENNKLRCTNKLCPFRITGSLVNFFNALNAKGIGEKTCARLVDELNVKKPSDVLKLTKDDFKSLQGFKDKSAKLAIDTIKEILNKPRTIPAILSALGIDCFRASTATKVLEKIDINKLVELAESGDEYRLTRLLRQADGIDKNADIISRGLIDNSDELKTLLSLMKIKQPTNIATDKVAVVSGFRGDDKFIEIANKAGYAVKDSGKVYDLLIVKDESYINKTKGRYATQHNIPIVTKKEFIETYSG